MTGRRENEKRVRGKNRVVGLGLLAFVVLLLLVTIVRLGGIDV